MNIEKPDNQRYEDHYIQLKEHARNTHRNLRLMKKTLPEYAFNLVVGGLRKYTWDDETEIKHYDT